MSGYFRSGVYDTFYAIVCMEGFPVLPWIYYNVGMNKTGVLRFVFLTDEM